MRIADANTILRFFLKDNSEQFAEAEKVFDSKEEIFIPDEIIAEVVYVLQKVYSVSREEIRARLIEFISYQNVILNESDITINALNAYATSNLDYADCIVYSHAKSKSSDIFSFDKGLLSFFKKNKKD
ncbi:MAG TPA: PIN domain-containing protein [Leptospiraceae bacterium]|nr:PIN domain-containing protein [Leptospiraceae bacterium]HMZ67414.1 PIN domain-containing protein [Leptospiraceae bacterium]HNA06423.1 PIN domain-containing protein [Leptospiraceae bacterium]HNC54338.1 PIN domain-containing protein [Leptospiraceae bacterium]HNE52575.1 PIN domain-containing protein [Leptospiraceae bacterium]